MRQSYRSEAALSVCFQSVFVSFVMALQYGFCPLHGPFLLTVPGASCLWRLTSGSRERARRVCSLYLRLCGPESFVYALCTALCGIAWLSVQAPLFGLLCPFVASCVSGRAVAHRQIRADGLRRFMNELYVPFYVSVRTFSGTDYLAPTGRCLWQSRTFSGCRNLPDREKNPRGSRSIRS